MPTRRKTDDSTALTEPIQVMVTKAEAAKVQALANHLGISRSAVGRMLFRAGFETPQIKSFTPQETDTP